MIILDFLMKNRIEAKRYKRNVRKEFINYSEKDG